MVLRFTDRYLSRYNNHMAPILIAYYRHHLQTDFREHVIYLLLHYYNVVQDTCRPCERQKTVKTCKQQ